jgi:hypothetical protein
MDEQRYGPVVRQIGDGEIEPFDKFSAVQI